jgi:HAD superfamily hydrolase (TIGR01509 family)
MTAFRGLLFDVGGVLTQPLRPIMVEAALATGLDLSGIQDVVRPMFSSPGDSNEPAHLMERGELSLDDFLAHLGSAQEVTRQVFLPSSEHYVFKRFAPHDGMANLARDAQDAGLTIGIVSNVISEWMPAWDNVIAATGVTFDDRVMSCEVGHRKPNPAIYELALTRLGLAASTTLFIDDFAPMAQGARDVGMVAVTLVDHDVAIAEARKQLGLR